MRRSSFESGERSALFITNVRCDHNPNSVALRFPYFQLSIDVTGADRHNRSITLQHSQYFAAKCTQLIMHNRLN